MDELEKSYLNKDLYKLSESDFCKSIENDFTNDSFMDQLEWALILSNSKFTDERIGNAIKSITKNSFDKSFLIAGSGNNICRDEIFFSMPFSDLQANPSLFPYLNIRNMTIHKTITFQKVKELRPEEKRNIYHKKRYVFEVSYAYYNKIKDSFYTNAQGWEVGDDFFKFNIYNKKPNEHMPLPTPISLKPGYVVDKSYIPEAEVISEYIKNITFAYNIALTMFYEWSVYLKNDSGIGIIIPIDPLLLPEIYKTSIMKFENPKKMLHFVKDHYRRKTTKDFDYSIYVSKYLRGEYKFKYMDSYAEIIPPKYDLNRIKTKKKFINTID
jgi:hypothetical protein